MPEPNLHLPERRCTCCNALLFTAKIEIGIVRIKCKCGTYNTITADKDNSRDGGRKGLPTRTHLGANYQRQRA